MTERYWVETLGCPKNQVDSDKLSGTLVDQGYAPADGPGEADLIVVNTCAFIEAARQESIDTVLELAGTRREGARLVVSGCMAERYGPELAAALPEVDLVAGFGVPVALGRRPEHSVPSDEAQPPALPELDLLNLARPATSAPWAYVKVAEGCDRICGFCAIPSFRGRQRSRPVDAVLREVEALGGAVREVVLVAQDLASYGIDRAEPNRPRGRAPRPIVDLVRRLGGVVDRVRLLYLYPSSLDDELIETIVGTGVAYFDLSLQHVSRPLVRRMRRYGDAERFAERIAAIRAAAPDATLRSSFILGYPGETEDDHDQLLAFLDHVQLDWAGFFTFSEEAGTHAVDLDAKVPAPLALERLRECAELQDEITAQRRARLVGEEIEVLVDSPGVARSYREAPEIDGVVHVPSLLGTGELSPVVVTGAAGVDLWAEPLGGAGGASATAGRAAPKVAGVAS